MLRSETVTESRLEGVPLFKLILVVVVLLLL
jgi:hypothetical protein